MNSEHYTYRVIWSEDDQEHIGLCAEFPSLSWLDVDINKALDGIVALVKDTVADMVANNEAVPTPVAMRKYSGKFAVRVPPLLHRKLAIEAAENNISMNRLISVKLSL